MQDKLEKYAELALYVRELEAEMEKLKIEIFPAIQTVGQAVKIPNGTFSVVNRTTYEYSNEFLETERQLKATLKALQEEEVASGKATKKESQSFMFRAVSESKLGERKILEWLLNSRDGDYQSVDKA